VTRREMRISSATRGRRDREGDRASGSRPDRSKVGSALLSESWHSTTVHNADLAAVFEKAQKLGVPTVEEKEFLKLLER
jgi:hypothetical protein